MLEYCPRCNKRFVVGFDTTDFVHTCDSGNLALDQEDVVIVGNWEDYSGSGTMPAQEVMRQGAHNELQGRRPQVEYNEVKHKVTRRGLDSSTRRQRQHEEFINIKDGGNN